MTNFPPHATVLPVALVDEFESLFTAQGIELALLSQTTAVVLVVGFALVTTAVAAVVALLPTLPTAEAVILQVGAP